MTQDRNTMIAEALDKLFRTYQQSNRDADPGDLARERIARAKVYFEAVSIYETRDIIQGIDDFITGSVPGHNPDYAPSAPRVGSAVRRAMERRLDAERLDRLALPPPADDFVDDPPEVKARNKAKLDALVESLGKTLRTEDAENDRKAKELTARVNARFAPEMDSRSMAKRLGLAIDVGDDPEADYGDMGGERVA